MPAPIASWDPARDVWTDESRIDLFSEQSAVYSETFPVLGSMRTGQAFAHRTSAHLMGASASSSSHGLLPTPEAYDGQRGGPQDPVKRLAGGHAVSLQDVVCHLPTPRATDWKAGYASPATVRRVELGQATMPEYVVALFSGESMSPPSDAGND